MLREAVPRPQVKIISLRAEVSFFTPGEIEKTVEILVLNNPIDEGEEIIYQLLSNPQGAYIADGEAMGTISNSGSMPRAWTARFGRARWRSRCWRLWRAG